MTVVLVFARLIVLGIRNALFLGWDVAFVFRGLAFQFSSWCGFVIGWWGIVCYIRGEFVCLGVWLD